MQEIVATVKIQLCTISLINQPSCCFLHVSASLIKYIPYLTYFLFVGRPTGSRNICITSSIKYMFPLPKPEIK